MGYRNGVSISGIQEWGKHIWDTGMPYIWGKHIWDTGMEYSILYLGYRNEVCTSGLQEWVSLHIWIVGRLWLAGLQLGDYSGGGVDGGGGGGGVSCPDWKQ